MVERFIFLVVERFILVVGDSYSWWWGDSSWWWGIHLLGGGEIHLWWWRILFPFWDFTEYPVFLVMKFSIALSVIVFVWCAPRARNVHVCFFWTRSIHSS